MQTAVSTHSAQRSSLDAELEAVTAVAIALADPTTMQPTMIHGMRRSCFDGAGPMCRIVAVRLAV